MATKDALGDRMKDYEGRSKTHLQRRTHTLLRLDGKAFHTFTRGYKRPYDLDLMGYMDAAALALCEKIEGARFGFVQSDEIQILLTDFGNQHSEMWFDGEVQKIVSVSASIATAAFNHALNVKRLETAFDKRDRLSGGSTSRELLEEFVQAPQALFDSRVWQIAPRIEVYNAFLWRQQDATRNAISMTAQANFSHRQLQGKSSNEMQELLWQEKGLNFNDQPTGFKRGRFIEKVTSTQNVTYTDKRTGEQRVAENVMRSQWVVTEPPIFSTPEGRQWLMDRIPQPGV
jgi:tRNA(His) 5'-end guanylyltransferase